MHAATEAAIPGPAYGLWQDRRPAASGSLKVLGTSEAAFASRAESRTDWILLAAAVVLTAVAFAMMLHAAPGACALTGEPGLLGPC